jgi:hypothetical protein
MWGATALIDRNLGRTASDDHKGGAQLERRLGLQRTIQPVATEVVATEQDGRAVTRQVERSTDARWIGRRPELVRIDPGRGQRIRSRGTP